MCVLCTYLWWVELGVDDMNEVGHGQRGTRYHPLTHEGVHHLALP